MNEIQLIAGREGRTAIGWYCPECGSANAYYAMKLKDKKTVKCFNCETEVTITVKMERRKK